MKICPLTKAMRKALPVGRCGAIIVAAGTASRMGGIDKVMAPLEGEPMLMRSVRTFAGCDVIREIVIVTREDLLVSVMDLCAKIEKVKAVVVGGATRQESVEAGMHALSSGMQLVAVHDGARPLITEAVIDRTVRAAHTYFAAAPGIPVKDTIKTVQGGVVRNTPDRSTLQAIQTPQVFDFALLRGALKKAKDDAAAVTDDCSAVERMGMSVKIVEGDERNIKVTTPMDLEIAKLLLEEL